MSLLAHCQTCHWQHLRPSLSDYMLHHVASNDCKAHNLFAQKWATQWSTNEFPQGPHQKWLIGKTDCHAPECNFQVPHVGMVQSLKNLQLRLNFLGRHVGFLLEEGALVLLEANVWSNNGPSTNGNGRFLLEHVLPLFLLSVSPFGATKYGPTWRHSKAKSSIRFRQLRKSMPGPPTRKHAGKRVAT